MPRRTQEYRDARRQQILQAARRSFVRDGFHETSMQDLFAEAGVSAGAVYSYFASKDEVIAAIVEENLRDVMALIHSLAAQPHQEGLGATLASVLDLLVQKNADDALGPVALLVWAESLRNPVLRERFVASLTQLRHDLAEVVSTRQRQGGFPASVEPAGAAGLLLAIVPGFLLQLALLGGDSLAEVANAARTLWPD